MIPKPFRKRSEKGGLPPGTLVHIGERKAEKVRITTINYDETQFQEKEVETIEECFSFKDTPAVTWINIGGIHQLDTIEDWKTLQHPRDFLIFSGRVENDQNKSYIRQISRAFPSKN